MTSSFNKIFIVGIKSLIHYKKITLSLENSRLFFIKNKDLLHFYFNLLHCGDNPENYDKYNVDVLTEKIQKKALADNGVKEKKN